YAGGNSHQILKTAAPAAPCLRDGFLRRPAKLSVEEVGDRTIHELAEIRDLQQSQPHRVHIKEPSVEVHNLHAIARAVDDPPVDLLCLPQPILVALACGDIGDHPSQHNPRPLLVSRRGTPRVKPPHAAVAVNKAVLAVVKRSVSPEVS